LLDALTIQAVNRYSKLSLREAPMLLCEFHGTASERRRAGQNGAGLRHRNGGLDFEWATRQEERTAPVAGAARRVSRVHAAAPGSRGISTDVCVPVSTARRMHSATNAILRGSRCRSRSSATSATATSTS
jgi:D-lactate dehydrogenase (cytochrome)